MRATLRQLIAVLQPAQTPALRRELALDCLTTDYLAPRDLAQALRAHGQQSALNRARQQGAWPALLCDEDLDAVLGARDRYVETVVSRQSERCCARMPASSLGQ